MSPVDVFFLIGLVMKAIFVIPLVISFIGHTAAANAQSRACDRILRDLDNLAQQIGAHSDSYWARRSHYLELKHGDHRSPSVSVTKAAEREKLLASESKSSVPNLLANFRSTAAEAKSQQCLPPARLLAIRESAIKLARKVNFDRFPEDESSRGEDEFAASVPPRMPK
jgi:hypothetical protein